MKGILWPFLCKIIEIIPLRQSTEISTNVTYTFLKCENLRNQQYYMIEVILHQVIERFQNSINTSLTGPNGPTNFSLGLVTPGIALRRFD